MYFFTWKAYLQKNFHTLSQTFILSNLQTFIHTPYPPVILYTLLYINFHISYIILEHGYPYLLILNLFPNSLSLRHFQ